MVKIIRAERSAKHAVEAHRTKGSKMNPISPTHYPDVNEILNLLLTNIKDILHSQFVGMYLFGSLANGDFDLYSDIDVLIVTDGEISSGAFSKLQNMHAEVAKIDSPWAIQQEVSYIPQKDLRRFDPPNIRHPHLDRGNNEVLHMMAHESDWIIQRYLLRERGIVITGPDLKTLIDPIAPYELRQAVVDVLPLWVNPILDNPSKIKSRGYQSFCVLSLCRMLYTLQNKAILSKPAAAKWAIETLDSRWRPLIERAVMGRQNSNLEALPEDINETLDMMRYTLEVSKQPSIFPEVNEVLNLLLSKAKEILKDQFVGMYLYGSLSSGDFNPATSDIDFLVVTTGSLSEQPIAALEAMHKRAWATHSKRAGKLEGAYVPKDLIDRHDPNGRPCPTINEGKFYIAGLGSDWIIQRHVVREQGIVLSGPDPKTLIDPVSRDHIRNAVIGILNEWWFPMLEDPSWLRDHESEYRAFAVITMCRVLHALEHGTIVSKPKAIQWARKKLEDRWKQMIDKAVAVSQHNGMDLLLEDTLDFIRFTREQILKGEANNQ
jgi:predicted nucleotidyltransferase